MPYINYSIYPSGNSLDRQLLTIFTYQETSSHSSVMEKGFCLLLKARFALRSVGPISKYFTWNCLVIYVTWLVPPHPWCLWCLHHSGHLSRSTSRLRSLKTGSLSFSLGSCQQGLAHCKHSPDINRINQTSFPILCFFIKRA